jgi:hypothetical protein
MHQALRERFPVDQQHRLGGLGLLTRKQQINPIIVFLSGKVFPGIRSVWKEENVSIHVQTSGALAGHTLPTS